LWVLIGEFWYLSPPGAIAPKADPADADGDRGVIVPNVAMGGEDSPVVEMASAVASADSGAGSDTATDDDDDAASADINFFAAVESSSTAEVALREAVHRAEVRRRRDRAGSSEKIVDHIDHPGASNPNGVIDYFNHRRAIGRLLAHVRAAHVDRDHATSPHNGPPTGYYYYTGGAATYIQNPGGADIPPGASAHGAPAGYYYKAGATGYIEDPPGTYSPAGATAPIADPGGTYSAAGASAPTTDPAGTYSSPYALTRLFLDPNPTTPATGVLSFNSAAAVADYYGETSFEASLAKEFFAGYGDTSATMLFTRYSAGGDRPHLYGGNLSNNLTPKDLQNGSLSITFDGLTWPEPVTYSVGLIDLFGATRFSAAAKIIQNAINTSIDQQPLVVTSGSTITPFHFSFTGSIIGDLLQITSVSSGGSIELGAEISGPDGNPIGQIVTQRDGTTGGPGLYTLFAKAGTVLPETMTDSYGVLTVGSVSGPGAVAFGERVPGVGVQSDNPMTAIDGPGPWPGTWLVNNAPAEPIGPEDLTMTATPLVVNYNSLGGATGKRNFFEIQPNGAFGYDYNPSTLSFASGTVADELLLTGGSPGAIDSFHGGKLPPASAYMSNVVQNEYSQFGSFQATWETLAQLDPSYLGNLAIWAQSTGDLYTFLNQWTNTTLPAGSSLPMTDPAGTYSGPGASAPTLDPPGTHSGPGASAPTPDMPGIYINQADTPFSGAAANGI
jgi:hypothetical protein